MGFLGESTLASNRQGALGEAVRAQQSGQGSRVCDNHKVLAKDRVPESPRQPVTVQSKFALVLTSLFK